MRPPEYIVVHHSLTRDGLWADWEAIRRYHTSWRYAGDIVSPAKGAALRKQGKKVEAPWTDIGYHLGIENVGGEIVLQQGRPIGTPGAHCVEGGMNGRSVGICVLGDFDLLPPPLKTLDFLRSVVSGLIVKYGIPVENVIGHREAGLMAGYDWEKKQYKTCPGRLFPMDSFRDALAGKT